LLNKSYIMYYLFYIINITYMAIFQSFVYFIVSIKFFERAQILNVHDLNTNLNYCRSSNVLSLYCIFDWLIERERERERVPLVHYICACYKTPTVLLIYIVKSSKSIVGDREKKRKLVIEVKDPLSFEIWIFRNGQTVRDDNRSIFVAI
jgi:hypothetical protein